MAKRRRLVVTDEMERRLAAVARAYETYLPGGESSSVVELPKLALADALLRAIAADDRRRARGLIAAVVGRRTRLKVS